MKTIILVLALVAITTAIPKPTNLHFRNLYKAPHTHPRAIPIPRILGGQEAEVNQIPYQALFEFYGSSSGWYCGGALISENYILTAAHCADDATVAHVTLGAHRVFDHELSQEKILSRNITIHPQWNKTLVINDIALVALPRKARLSQAIAPAVLPQRHPSTDLTGETATISGWGYTNIFDDVLSEVLNYVNVKVITNDECGRIFANVLESTLCTSGDDLTGACTGDSGGPLAIKDVLVGIGSYSSVYCAKGYPSVFARVTSFLNWIEDNSDVIILQPVISEDV